MYKDRKGIRYFARYTAARFVRDQLKPLYPEARVVDYTLGFAVQYRISGAYFPESQPRSE